LGLLIEEQRTNLKTFSEAISTANGYGANNSTLTAVTTQTPIQGLMTASKFALNTGANSGNSADGFNFGGAITLASSTAHTQSIMVKADGASVVRLRSNVTGQLFDIPIAGPAPSPSGAITGCSVQQLGNGWARVSWTFTTGASGVPATRSDYWAIKTDVADGSAGFLVVGAQLEAGAFPSSYIPTVASQVTRSRDEAIMTGANFSSWYNQMEGSFYAEGSAATGSGRFPALAVISEGAAVNNSLAFGYLTGSVGGFEVRSGNALQVNMFPSVTTFVRKAAFGFAVDNFAISYNGANVSTDTSGQMPVVDRLTIGAAATLSAASTVNGHIRKVAFYPKRLANAELQGITTV
jgi:hypothetical protein